MAETGVLRATKTTQYGYYYGIRMALPATALADDEKEQENERASLVRCGIR